MVIQVSIEKTEPLTGTTSANGKNSVAFVGWLDLLRAISDLVGAEGYGSSFEPAMASDDGGGRR